MDATTAFAITAISTFPSLQDSIQRIYSTIYNILQHRHADIVQGSVNELDIETSIQSIESFLHNLKTKNNGLLMCVERINAIIKRIHTLLASIETKLNRYQQSWVVWLFQGVNVYTECEDIRREKQRLDSMVDTLMKMLVLESLSTLHGKNS